MRLPTLVGLLTLIMAISACGGGGGGPSEPIIDQEYYNPTPRIWWNVWASATMAQTFTAGMTGRLTSVELLMNQDALGSDLLFDVRPTTGGVPNNSDTSVLASVVVPDGMMPTTADMYAFDLTGQEVPLTAGVTYAIVLRVPGAGGNYHVGLDQPAPYDGGEAWERVNPTTWNNPASLDSVFRTWVQR